jgi:sigma-B regulation protein RsbU (phosphoserine phosphatase)
MVTDPWEFLLEGGWQDEPALLLAALRLALLGGQDEFDESQLSSAAGVGVSTTRQLWRAMGFPDAEPGTPAFTRADLDALRRVGAALALRGEDTVIEHARVLSSLLARAADVVATSLTDDIRGYRRAGLAHADAAAAAVVQLRLLEISALVDYLFRRQLVTVLTRQLTAERESSASADRAAAVIFADLVGFTTLSQQLEDDDLAVLVTRFQSLAFDLVAASGGRVVKTLGDEVMVVCEDVDAAIGVATALAKAYADDELLPDVRVGMAYGPVLRVQGDYFGPTVNLASRLVGIAGPGAVIISDDARRALGTESQFQPTELRPRRLKDIGWTVCWVVDPSSVSGTEMSEAALEGFYAALLDDDAEELYERAPCGYLSTTPDGSIIKVNHTFLTWTGYEPRDLVGRRSFIDLLTGGGRIYYETHYAPMLQMQGMVREIALDIVGADGRRIPALVNAVLERDAAGNPVVVRAAVFDATERREYERELLRAKQRAEDSEAEARLLARTLQQTLIPPALPTIPGLDLAAAYRPAGSGEQVGGDFYDVFQVAEGDWMIVIGDVCGKGVEAAIVSALARHTIRGAAVREREPSLTLEALNEVLLRHGSERFCTVALARLHEIADGWRLTVCSGGHPLPLLAGSGVDPAPVGHPGALLGAFGAPALHDCEMQLGPGDRLVFYTDGVSEGRRGREFYGEKRLEAAVGGGGSARVMVERILQDVLYFQGGAPADDIAIVILHVP